MGCTESVPVASAFNVPIAVDSRIPRIGGLPPSNEKTQLIVKEKLFSFGGDSYKIKTRDGGVFHGMQIKGKTFAFRDQMALLDGNGQPIAVCLRKFQMLGQTFKIYTLQPMYSGQPRSEHDYNGRALYTYAQVERSPGDTVQNVTFDDKGTPAFTIHRVGDWWPKQRTVRYHGVPVALMEGGTWDANWNSYLLTINPGIDPCLIVCLTAICDEMDESR
jgi:LURP-one-related